MILLLFAALAYPYFPDHGPAYYDPLNGSSLANSFSCLYSLVNGSQKVLGKQFNGVTNTNAVFSISDNSWSNEEYDNNFSQLQKFRQTGLKFNLYSGNFSTSIARFFFGKGYYWPQLSRGVQNFYYNAFATTEYPEQEMEELAEQSTDWPPLSYYNLTAKEVEEAANNKLKQCSGEMYYTLSQVCREPSKQYEYPPDYRQIYTQDGVQINSSCELVYFMNATIISRECAFIINASGMVYNEAENQKKMDVFNTIMLVLSVIQAYSALTFVFKHNMEHEQMIPTLVLILWTNAAYLFIIFCCMDSVLFGNTYRTGLLLTFLQACCIIIPFGRLLFRIFMYARRQFDSFITMIIIVLVFAVGSIFPGFVILFLAIYLKFEIVAGICMIFYEWLCFYVVIILFGNDLNKPSIPFHVIVTDYLNKALALGYVLCISVNAFEFETHWQFAIPILLPFVLLIMYVIQIRKGPTLGRIPKRLRQTLYNYTYQLLSESTIKNAKRNDAGQIVVFENQDLGCCQNPSHQHSDNYKPDSEQQSYALGTWQTEKNYNFDADQCFCVVEKNSLDLQCSICLDSINLSEYIERNRVGKMKRLNQLEAQGEEEEDEPLLQEDQLYITPCKHYFHRHCLEQWLQENKVCPVDRNPLLMPME